MSNDGGVSWLQAESRESIDTFLVGLAGSDDDDFEHTLSTLSLQPPWTNLIVGALVTWAIYTQGQLLL